MHVYTALRRSDMGEILGIGLTHYPPLASRDENMAGILRHILQDPGLPDHYRHPESWPVAMRQEYGEDQGLSAARRHRAARSALPAVSWKRGLTWPMRT